MANKETFVIRPMEHAYDMSYQPLDMPHMAAAWPTLNVDVKRNSIQKRWGESVHRTLKSGATFYGSWIFRIRDGTRHMMILTDTDLIQVKYGSGETWQYRTESYATGLIDSITTDTVEGDGDVDWVTADIEADDEFIMVDDYDPQVEHDANWIPVESRTDLNTLVLDSNYTKNGTEYKIRKIYSVPSGERWKVAIVGNKFCFTNGDVNVQYWDGVNTNDATELDGTNAVKARYCIEYANRLILADHEISSTREPWTVSWSKEGDPTDWTDSTAGSVDLLNTDEHILGLGKVGNQLVVYKGESLIFGRRTGISTSPIIFPTERVGTGLLAPNSIVNALGSNAFLGHDDFYFIEGDRPVSIGERIRDKFFDLVNDADRRKVFGVAFPRYNKAFWFAVTPDGQIAFVWDWKEKEWTSYRFFKEITGGGEGII